MFGRKNKNSVDFLLQACYNTKDMNRYCHRRTYQLRYSDFDFKDELKLSSLLALIQESACLSADELGFGYDALKPLNYGFITVQTSCEFVSSVQIGDELTIETWPLPPRHVIFERDYRVKNQRGEVIANLASRWCLVDLKDFKLLLPEALKEAHEKCPYNPEKTLDVPFWKIPKLSPSDKREIYGMRVGNSRLDHYFHANNTFYADFFLDCFSMEELRPIKAFQIAYIKQAKEGAELKFYRKDEGKIAICEAFQGDELISQFRLEFKE